MILFATRGAWVHTPFVLFVANSPLTSQLRHYWTHNGGEEYTRSSTAALGWWPTQCMDFGRMKRIWHLQSPPRTTKTSVRPTWYLQVLAIRVSPQRLELLCTQVPNYVSFTKHPNCSPVVITDCVCVCLHFPQQSAREKVYHSRLA